MEKSVHLAVLGVAVASVTATAQVSPTLPLPRTMDMLVSESGFGIWRLVDWNQDNDFNDANEVQVYYDQSIGGLNTGLPNGLAVMANGTVLAGDHQADTITAMLDVNGDGDAHDSGEQRVYFDNTNASGIQIYSLQKICVDRSDRVYVTNADNNMGGSDAIYVLEDLNGDGDCLDAGEARDYFTVAGAVWQVALSKEYSVPRDIVVGADNSVYYLDNNSEAWISRGVYRLTDLNSDGDCNDAGEWSLFWHVVGAGTPRNMGVDDAGGFYLTRTYDPGHDDEIWWARDVDGNNQIDPIEASIFFQCSNCNWVEFVLRDDGWLLLPERQSGYRITGLRDDNGDGDALDPGESRSHYSHLLTTTVVPVAAAFVRAPVLSAVPATTPIGSTVSLDVRAAKPSDLCVVFMSGSLAPVPVSLDPYGFVEIATSGIVLVGWSVSGVNADASVPLVVPNTVSALGTYGLQAWCGRGPRFYLSNGTTLNVTL